GDEDEKVDAALCREAWREIEGLKECRIHEAGDRGDAITVEHERLQDERLSARVDTEGGVAVGAGRHVAEWTRAVGASCPIQEAADRVDAAVPLGQWWHAQGRVLSEQSDEPVDVGLLPGTQVAFDQIPFRR